MHQIYIIISITTFLFSHILANCDPQLKSIKSELSKRIDQSLHRYYILQSQTKTISEELKNLDSQKRQQLSAACSMDKKLVALKEIIEKYKQFLKSAQCDMDLEPLNEDFFCLCKEIFNNNLKCLEKFKELCY